MTMQTNGETAWEYEREAEAHRHRLVETLDELNARLSPGQVLDEVLTYARVGGGNFGQAVMNAARQHPIPTVLIGAGVLLFMSDRLGLGLSERIGLRHSGPRTRTAYREYSVRERPIGGAYGTTAAETAGLRSPGGHSTVGSAHNVGESGGGLRERAAAAGERVSETASSAAERAREAAQDARDQMAYAAGRTSETARDMAYRTKSFAEEQPLVTIAIGAAAGGLLAAALTRGRTHGSAYEESPYEGVPYEGARYGSPYEAERYDYRSRGTIDRARETASSAAERAREAAAMAAERARGTAQGVRQQMSHLTQSARELGHSVQEYSASMRDQAAYAADRTSQTARHVAYRTRSFAEEQPLMTAAIGVAVGALLAAALPRTRTENQYLGDASDSVKRTFRETASEQYQSIKGAAGRVAEEVGAAAREEGLTTEDAAAAARDVGDRVSRVVEEGTESAKSEMDRMSKGER